MFSTPTQLFITPHRENYEITHNYAQIRKLNIASEMLRPKSPHIVMSFMEYYLLLEK